MTVTTGVCTRRAVVTTAGALGLCAALTGCGAADDGSEPGEKERGTDGASPEHGAELAKTSEIPEGGGTVFREAKVVVAQPSAGEFVAYSAICTHQGCVVDGVHDGVIHCPCHHSAFSVKDGSVQAGPARRPLPPVRIDVKGDSVRLR